MMTPLKSLFLCIAGLILILAPASPCFPGTAQKPPGLVITADLQFAYAQQLFETGDYPTAQVEFKRFTHFFPDDKRKAEAQYKTGAALFHAKNFHESAKVLNRVILKEDPDHPWARESFFMQSRAFAAAGNTGYAQVVLQNLIKLTREPFVRDRVYHELARIHIRETMNLGKDELDRARKYLTLISPGGKEGYRVQRQLTAIDKAEAAPQKNPALAGVLAVIPGGGLLYCERYKDAFVSFCLNAGLIWAAYEAFDQDNPALGGIISFVEAGFYTGNIYGSVTAAHKHNKAARIRILNREFNLGAGIDPVNQSFALTLSHDF